MWKIRLIRFDDGKKVWVKFYSKTTLEISLDKRDAILFPDRNQAVVAASDLMRVSDYYPNEHGEVGYQCRFNGFEVIKHKGEKK
jgi:hypothetical protein